MATINLMMPNILELIQFESIKTLGKAAKFPK